MAATYGRVETEYVGAEKMDRIVETDTGFDCIVNGERFGTWRSKAEAGAGMAVEQKRTVSKKRRAKLREFDALVNATLNEYNQYKGA